jgi:hypothetical protein
MGVKVLEMPRGLGTQGHKVLVIPRGLRVEGHNVCVLLYVLGGPVDQKSKSTWGWPASGGAFGALGGRW